MGMMYANRGIFSLLNLAIGGATDLRAAVFTGTVPAAGTIADWNFLSDVIADASSAESVATNYTRQDLGSVAVAEVDGSDNVTLTAAAPNFGGANIGTGETWTFIAYYIEGASDAARVLICIDDPASDLVTNGGPVTLPAFSTTIQGGAGNFTLVTRGLYLLLTLAISGSTDLRCVPFTGTKPSAATVRDWNTLADAIADGASAEAVIGGAGAHRFDLAGVTLTEDDTANNVTLTATAPTFASVPAGETWTFLVYYVEAGSDATRELIAVDLTTASQVTNGSNISYSALAVTIDD